MPTTFTNAAEMQERLGAVPLERIRMSPLPGTATVDDLEREQARCDVTLELVDGTLVEKGMGTWESRVGGILFLLLENFASEHDLGIVLPGDGHLRVEFDLVRAPDVSFVSWSQFPDRALPEEAFWDVHPDLAVEVLSRSNTAVEMERKTREYLAAGASLVWVIDPEKRAATVHRPDTAPVEVDESGTLDGGEVLPGLSIDLGSLFARAAGTRPTDRP